MAARALVAIAQSDGLRVYINDHTLALMFLELIAKRKEVVTVEEVEKKKEKPKYATKADKNKKRIVEDTALVLESESEKKGKKSESIDMTELDVEKRVVVDTASVVTAGRSDGGVDSVTPLEKSLEKSVLTPAEKKTDNVHIVTELVSVSAGRCGGGNIDTTQLENTTSKVESSAKVLVATPKALAASSLLAQKPQTVRTAPKVKAPLRGKFYLPDEVSFEDFAVYMLDVLKHPPSPEQQEEIEDAFHDASQFGDDLTKTDALLLAEKLKRSFSWSWSSSRSHEWRE
jgi:hypothetical protein